MARPICPPEENIVRAICSPDHYDPATGRIAPSLFSGSSTTSVSRLKILALEDHWELFRRHVAKPHQCLDLFGEINVGTLQDIGRTYQSGPPEKLKPQPVELTVEEAPEDWNPAHAEIPQKISRGLANKIVDALSRHLPVGG